MLGASIPCRCPPPVVVARALPDVTTENLQEEGTTVSRVWPGTRSLRSLHPVCVHSTSYTLKNRDTHFQLVDVSFSSFPPHPLFSSPSLRPSRPPTFRLFDVVAHPSAAPFMLASRALLGLAWPGRRPATTRRAILARHARPWLQPPFPPTVPLASTHHSRG